MSNLQKVMRIENVDKYNQQYVNGALVLTLREEYVEELSLCSTGLSELPPLPPALKKLWCNSNHLTKLPDILPNTLTMINCSSNKLTALPEVLPDSLTFLYCANNKLTALPAKLPPNLQHLYVGENCLTVLPDLPNTLTCTDFRNNKLEANYPKLDTCTSVAARVAYVNQRNREMRNALVEELNLCNTGLSELPQLPPNLKRLLCGNNLLTKLPDTLPTTLKTIDCYKNQLTTLPEKLPTTLERLHVGDNKLSALPEVLPDTLTELYCYGNKLTHLPAKLPPSLQSLMCDTNCLTVLPDLPTTLTTFDCCTNPCLTANYPDLDKQLSMPNRIDYVNRRNREMREACESPLIVTEDWIRNTSYGHLKPVTCIIKKNDVVISNLNSTDFIKMGDIEHDLYKSFGIPMNGYMLCGICDFIRIVKRNNMSIDIVMVAPSISTTKRYRYTYGI